MENDNLREDSDSGDFSEDLDDQLVRCAHYPVPDDFLSEALLRFDVASAVTVESRGWLAPGIGISAILLISGSVTWLALFNLAFISKAVAALSRIGLLTLSYILEMWHQMPEIGTGILLCLWTIMFVCAVMLIKAFRVATVSHTTAG